MSDEIARHGALSVWTLDSGDAMVAREDAHGLGEDAELTLTSEEWRWLILTAGPSILLAIGAVPTLNTKGKRDD